MNKKDLAAGVKQMRSVAKLLTQWADDLEASAGGVSAAVGGTASDTGAGVAVGIGADVGSSSAVSAARAAAVAPAPAPAPTLAEVKKYLTEKCAAGYSAQVKAAIASFGVSSLSGVPAEKYAELMALTAGIGGDADAG